MILSIRHGKSATYQQYLIRILPVVFCHLFCYSPLWEYIYLFHSLTVSSCRVCHWRVLLSLFLLDKNSFQFSSNRSLNRKGSLHISIPTFVGNGGTWLSLPFACMYIFMFCVRFVFLNGRYHFVNVYTQYIYLNMAECQNGNQIDIYPKSARRSHIIIFRSLENVFVRVFDTEMKEMRFAYLVYRRTYHIQKRCPFTIDIHKIIEGLFTKMFPHVMASLFSILFFFRIFSSFFALLLLLLSFTFHGICEFSLASLLPNRHSTSTEIIACANIDYYIQYYIHIFRFYSNCMPIANCR